jgi:hypothetical protein
MLRAAMDLSDAALTAMGTAGRRRVEQGFTAALYRDRMLEVTANSE